MPRGRLNVENMPRGICRCGGPTIAIQEGYDRPIRMVCDRCRKPSEECACTKVEPVYCEHCGEKIGDRAPEGRV